MFGRALTVIAMCLSASGAVAQGLRGLDCVIQPSREVQLSSAVSGILESVEVDRSDAVIEGQQLARLNSGVERASVELARQRAESELAISSQQEKLALARRSLARVDTLHSNKMIS